MIAASQTPTDEEVNGSTLKKAMRAVGEALDVRTFGERVFNDLGQTWWMVLIGLICATLLSLLWIVAMR